MNAGQKKQAAPNVDDESGREIVVSQTGVQLQDKGNNDNESQFYLKPGDSVWYRSKSNFTLTFPYPAPVTICGGYGTESDNTSVSPPTATFTPQQNSHTYPYWLKLMVLTTAGTGRESSPTYPNGLPYNYSVSFPGTGVQHDPEMDIMC